MNLRKWKKELRDNLYVSSISDTGVDTDHPYCPRCNSIMNFYGHDANGDFPIGEGYWKCSCCDFSITENELYK